MDKVEFDMAGTRYVGRVMKQNNKTVLVEVPYTFKRWVVEPAGENTYRRFEKEFTGLKVIRRHLVKHNVTPFS